MAITNADLAAKILAILTTIETYEHEFQDWLNGTVGGGTFSDGTYPLTDRLTGDTTYFKCPAQLEDDVNGNVVSSATHKADAETAQTAAETAQTAAETAQGLAETAYSNATAQATNSANSASASATSAATALAQANNAATSYDNFDDRYLGSFATAGEPTVDNDGDALLTGAIYWNTDDAKFKVWDGAAWQIAYNVDVSDNFTWTGTHDFQGTTTIPQATVTAHQAALSITESQISDLQAYSLPGDNLTTFDGTNWRLFYTDGAGDVTELALGSSGQVLQSNGAAAAPSFTTLSSSVILENYIDGFRLENNSTDSEHDLDINPGTCANDANDAYITLSSMITKRIDANWAAGSGNGGFPSALTLSANSTYGVFTIHEEGGDIVDAGFDASLTAANLMSDATGYDHYRRVGFIRTDASSNILGFYQFNNSFILNAQIEEVADSSPGTSANTLTLSAVPTGVELDAVINLQADYTGANVAVLVTALTQDDIAAGTPSSDHSSQVNASAQFNNVEMRVKTNTSSQIRYRSNGNNVQIRIATKGWMDQRGQNGNG